MVEIGLFRLGQAGCYSIYVLVILLVAYLLNQLDRYMLAITNPSMSRDVGYGKLGCFKNLSLPESAFQGVKCTNETSKEKYVLISLSLR